VSCSLARTRMMLSETEFLSQVRTLLPEYAALSALCGFSGPPNPQHAYELYLNSGPRRDRAALPFLVLGRSNVDRANRLEGNAIDDEELWNFGATHHTNSDDPRVQPRDGLHFQGHKTALQGSILHFPVEAKRVNAASGGWHPMYNDSWVMGGVHAHLEFHLASPRISANIWNADANALTVTGRELTGLTRFGYERVKHPSSGAEVYLCDNRHRADSMTLGRYWIQIAAMMLERGRPLIDRFKRRPLPGCTRARSTQVAADWSRSAQQILEERSRAPSTAEIRASTPC